MPHVPPPVLALAAGAAQRLLAPDEPAGRVSKALAGAVAAGSVALLAGSTREFRRAHTTVNPLEPSRATALVTTGPNGLTRNPMYVGMAGLLAAHGLARGGVATALPVAAFVAAIDRLQIGPEERALRQLFGEEYDAYCRRVPRWLPRPC